MTHGSLFSGIGGFDLGALRAGIETKWNCEIEEHKRKVLSRHFPEAKQYCDITILNQPDYVDIISGGFPCQDISICNSKKNKNEYGIKGPRSGLWKEFWRILRQVRPKYVFIENSPMLAVRGLEYVLCDLAKIGYNAEWQTLSAQEFGFPHLRQRMFIMAYALQIGCENTHEYFRILQELLRKKIPRQVDISMPAKRYDGRTIDELVRIDDGFSKKLDKNRIEDCGNAVIPTIAQYLFEALIEFDKKNIIQNDK